MAMVHLSKRDWVPPTSEDRVLLIAARTADAGSDEVAARLDRLIDLNRDIYDRDCFNLNPAANVMNPRAEAMLSAGLGSRPSLGYPGDKDEMGLEAIEEIEVIAAELAAEVFGATFAEVRVASGAMANLIAFMATCKPGDAIIAPPSSIGGHITHHLAGCAGLYGLVTHSAPVDADGYTVNLEGLEALALAVRPKLMTLGGSLNLAPHPVRAVRAIADRVEAWLMVDAAHQCGLFAGRVWPNPLAEGAHLMTMTTDKSLGGPAGGLIVGTNAELARRLDAIVCPGMTANFDAGKTAALALTLLDWRDHGSAYAAMMVSVAQALAIGLAVRGIPVHGESRGFTRSHQFAVEAESFGGGHRLALRMARAGLLASGIGLPLPEVPGDTNGLRIGTPEIVRRGVTVEHADMLADLIARAMQADDPASLAAETAWRRGQFQGLHFVRW